MVKVCPRCGFQNPDDAMFCIRCGYPLGQTVTPQPSQVYQQPPVTAQPQSPPPTQYPPPPRQQQPAYVPYIPYPPQYYQPKTALDYGLMFSRIGVILFSLAIILGAISEILIFASAYSSNLPGNIVAQIILFIVSGAILIFLGIIPLLMGITKSITKWILMGGIAVFLYFLMFGISFIYLGVIAPSLGLTGSSALTGDGSLLVVASVFALLSALFVRNVMIGRKLFGVIIGLTSYFIGYSILGYFSEAFGTLSSLLSNGSSSSVSNVLTFIAGVDFFNTDPTYLSASFLIAILSVIVLLLKNDLKKYVNVFLGIAFLVFSLGVLYLGVESISGGIPSTSGLPGLLKAVIYLAVTGGIVDVVTGALLIVGSLLVLMSYLNSLTQGK